MSPNESTSAKRAPVPTRGPQAPRFIVIEGPLRVGKSTLAKILAERLHARRVYDCEDNPFLADFYKEKPGSALRAQMYFLMDRQKRPRVHRGSRPRLRTFLLPLRRLRPPRNQHLRNRFRRTQRRPPATPTPPPRPRKRHPIFPPPRPLGVGFGRCRGRASARLASRASAPTILPLDDFAFRQFCR